MAQKYLYEESYDVKGWFAPELTASGWFDDDFVDIVVSEETPALRLRSFMGLGL